MFLNKKLGKRWSKIRSQQHTHPLYQPTRITESIIDEERETAIWILFEQIDTDRLSAYGKGWLGDQFRYSLWVLKAGQEPQRVYEDHAYMRPRSISALTGTRGQDCTLKNLRIEDGMIKVGLIEDNGAFYLHNPR